MGTMLDKKIKRFFAVKLLEQDDKIGAQLGSMPDVSWSTATQYPPSGDAVDSSMVVEK